MIIAVLMGIYKKKLQMMLGGNVVLNNYVGLQLGTGRKMNGMIGDILLWILDILEVEDMLMVFICLAIFTQTKM